jgi:hypothetical protein
MKTHANHKNGGENIHVEAGAECFRGASPPSMGKRGELSEGQKATGSREMIRIDEGSTVRKESTLRGKPATAGKENKNGRPKREGDSG